MVTRMNEHPAPSADDIRAIAGAVPIKVWSWLTTVFGDLASAPGAEIGGVALGRLTERIGIRPEATRVALHRLRKDGWIVSRRVGRASRYALSAHGRAETERAGERIYAREVACPERWFLAVLPPDRPVPPGGLTIAPQTVLSSEPVERADALVAEVAASGLPSWVRRAGIPPEIEAGYAALSDILTRIEAVADAMDDGHPLDSACLRLMTLHHWRRALLRHDEAVERLGGPNWIGARCRRRTHALLDRLERPALDTL